MDNRKRCPFVNGFAKLCNDECAMNKESGCALVTGNIPNYDGNCPFTDPGRGMRCDEYCTFFDQGCALIRKEDGK